MSATTKKIALSSNANVATENGQKLLTSAVDAIVNMANSKKNGLVQLVDALTAPIVENPLGEGVAFAINAILANPQCVIRRERGFIVSILKAKGFTVKDNAVVAFNPKRSEERKNVALVKAFAKDALKTDEELQAEEAEKEKRAKARKDKARLNVAKNAEHAKQLTSEVLEKVEALLDFHSVPKRAYLARLKWALTHGHEIDKILNESKFKA